MMEKCDKVCVKNIQLPKSRIDLSGFVWEETCKSCCNHYCSEIIIEALVSVARTWLYLSP
jgi:hypothetical protein